MATIIGTGGNDAGLAALKGTHAADAIYGLAGNDELYGYAGKDTLDGGAGHDTAHAGAGADVLTGGEGTDTLAYDGSAAGVAVDLLAGTGKGGDAHGDSFTGFEVVRGSAFADTLRGGAAAELFSGRAGADTFAGRGGADEFFGGDGGDRFAYAAVADSAPGAQDSVGDWGAGDLIDLAAVPTGAAGAAFQFVGTAAFTAAGQVRYEYDPGAGRATVQVNTDADAGAEMEIWLSRNDEDSSVISLGAGDFLL